MPFRPLLAPGRVVLVDAATPASNRAEVLDLAARLLAAKGGLPPRQVHDLLVQREALASTGIGFGIAIPHARVADLAEDTGVFLRLPRGVDFGAADGIDVDLVFAMAVSEAHVQAHLRRLAAIADRLGNPAFCASLRAAADETALATLLLDADHYQSAA
ncbi:PTS sugar transporter subunit IIA [Marilutibacter aestuarii]|uniref:PTS sugar transporter subunit IIA n=1 Tax=Marilutibacter aestuarii TaxID=1706195 RepID=A0A508AHE3_9GAMM|nr:PTS sugar transporter subunit IIA [Lysobacter aestuarii]TQD48313.1 PTS sugar transporter subunit IIA [Lysobacter aestuarii]